MKKMLWASRVIIFVGFISACTYDKQTDVWCINPPETVLPNSVGLGESILYLNGEKLDWLPEIRMNDAQQIIGYSFHFKHPSKSIENIVGVGPVAIKTGIFKLYTLDDYLDWMKAGIVPPSDEAKLEFLNLVQGDEIGFEYRAEDIEQCFLKVDALDTVSRQVQARFRLKFCLNTKNGFSDDVGLPATMVFQGIFNEIASK